ncbi:delta-sarcoglycan [Willisornis vidua]|uniref:Delta-sarcoglycan n=1 Tax=Willisornis vidua TaxID=1566151 RepID=A0ABQ9CU67_9PASS|nr:delta-sarcoglycan [Willisornis vidua]
MDGMGNLRITEKGLKLEGDSEFLKPLYAKEIRSRPGNPLYFQSARNVTVNILNEKTKVLTRLVTGPQAVEAHSQKFEVKTLSGKLLFSADDNEVVVGAERLRVLGAEGTVFPKSIETPNVRADPFKELRPPKLSVPDDQFLYPCSRRICAQSTGEKANPNHMIPGDLANESLLLAESKTHG